jgi:hypothetical protein
MWKTVAIVIAVPMLAMAGSEPNHFDHDPGWEGYNNVIVPDNAIQVRQDFGYNGAGAIGGRIHRSTTKASYAAPLDPPRTLNDKLSASGSFEISATQSGGGVFFGFFNSQRPGGSGRPISSFGLNFGFERGGGRLLATVITDDDKSCGTFLTPYLPGKYRPTTLKNDGTRYDWTMNYDQDGARGNGQFTLTLRSDQHKAGPLDTNLPANAQAEALKRFPYTNTFVVDLTPGLKAQGATMDRFGVCNATKGGGAVTMLFSNLTLDGKPIDLSTDPKWIGHGNHVSFEDDDVTTAHHFGYSPDTHFAGGAAGEIGGSIWRGGKFAYYADRIGPLNLEQRLEAKGKVMLATAAPDSDICMGWFNSAASKTNGHGDTQDFVGVHIGGPTRIGHYFIPVFAASSGDRKIVKQGGPILVPGKATDWSIVYDPSDDGKISVTLGAESYTMALRPGQKAEGAKFDRFGLFNLAHKGGLVKLYIDDVEFTASPVVASP